MNVLITGGTGFIGRHLVHHYVTHGHTVAVIDNFSTSTGRGLPRGVTLLGGDLRTPTIPDTIQNLAPHLIIHAAHTSHTQPTSPERDWQTNAQGTALVIAGAKRLPTCRLVYLSSAESIYGETPTPARETTTVPHPTTMSGVHTWLAEQYVALSGLSHGIARLTTVYGPGQNHHHETRLIATLADQLTARRTVTIHGNGEHSRDLIHVHDVVEAIAVIAASPTNGTWNVGSGTETTINQLLTHLEAVLGPAIHTAYEPARLTDLRTSTVSIDRIASDLGWSPRIDLPTGLETLKPHTIHDLLP